MLEFPIEKYLCHFYLGLTAIKLLQMTLGWFSTKAAKGKKDTEKMEYSPSLQVLISFIDLLMDAPSAKIPRKELREVTDKWLNDYAMVLQSRGPKTFHSLEDAKRSFYEELSQDSSSSLIFTIAKLGTAYLRQPLGVVSVLEFVMYVPLVIIFMFRELIIGGNMRTLPCKLALAATITDVYVMACVDGICFEEALMKYPWMTGLFSKQQLHPMIGRAVCPVYKRQVTFPKDEMKFKPNFIATPSGMALLEQQYESFWGRLWEHFSFVNAIAFGVGLATCYRLFWTQQILDLQVLLLSGALFYSARWTVDRALGIRWIERYNFLP